jgi:hypothetical protein
VHPLGLQHPRPHVIPRDFTVHNKTSLSGRHGDVRITVGQSAGAELAKNLCWPSKAFDGKLKGQGYIDDDLLVHRLFLRLDSLEVGAASVTDVASNVEEANCGDLH